MDKHTKIKRNIVSGLLYQLITLAVGIAIPRLVLVSLGSESNGLLNSTNQAIVYLALLEGGIGWTITKSLYKPVAEDDRNEINGIMSAANLFYRNVGLWYLACLCVIAFIYAYTVETTLSKTTVLLVVLLTGMPQVINFLFQGKYRTLLSVSGYGYVLTNLSTGVYLCQSAAKIALLLNGFGLIALQTMYCVMSLAQMLYIISFVRRKFPWVDIHVKPLKDRIGQRSSVFVHQISGFIFSNSDMLVLTYFCGLKTVSVYSMYMMFYSMISGLISTITGSMNFAMGQLFNTDRKEYVMVQNAFDTLNLLLVFSAFSVLNVCIIPFLRLYTKGIEDICYIDSFLPFLFSGIMLLQCGRASYQKIIEYAGAFKETQWHAAVEVTLNLGVSLIGAFYMGLYGVLLGTIVALVFRNILMAHHTYVNILGLKQWPFYRKRIVNAVVWVVLQFVLNLWFTLTLQSYYQIVLYACLVMFIALSAFTIAAALNDRNSFKYIWVYYIKKKGQLA